MRSRCSFATSRPHAWPLSDSYLAGEVAIYDCGPHGLQFVGEGGQHNFIQERHACRNTALVDERAAFSEDARARRFGSSNRSPNSATARARSRAARKSPFASEASALECGRRGSGACRTLCGPPLCPIRCWCGSWRNDATRARDRTAGLDDVRVPCPCLDCGANSAPLNVIGSQTVFPRSSLNLMSRSALAADSSRAIVSKVGDASAALILATGPFARSSHRLSSRYFANGLTMRVACFSFRVPGDRLWFAQDRSARTG